MHMINNRVMTVRLPTQLLMGSIDLNPFGEQDLVASGAIVVSLSDDFAHGPLHICHFQWFVQAERRVEFDRLVQSGSVTRRNVTIIATHPDDSDSIEIGIDSIDLNVIPGGNRFHVNVIS